MKGVGQTNMHGLVHELCILCIVPCKIRIIPCILCMETMHNMHSLVHETMHFFVKLPKLLLRGANEIAGSRACLQLQNGRSPLAVCLIASRMPRSQLCKIAKHTASFAYVAHVRHGVNPKTHRFYSNGLRIVEHQYSNCLTPNSWK